MPKGKPNKRYTPEFKIKVVETMHREKLSYRETARQFDICDHDRVAAWEESILKKERRDFTQNAEEGNPQGDLRKLRMVYLL